MLKVMLSFHRNNHKPTNPNRTTVEELKVFEDVILNLKAELAQYLGLADGVAKVDLLVKNEENYQAGQQHTRKQFFVSLLQLQ